MKKSKTRYLVFLKWLWGAHFFKVMRVTIFLMLLAISNIYANSTYSQSTKFSLNLRNITLDQLFEEIQNQSEFNIFYNDSQVNLDRKITIKVNESSVEEVLRQAFEGEDLNFYVFEKQIVIFPETKEENLKELNKDLPQQKSVSGKVVDSSGLPLPGVTVIVKGSTKGTISDGEGNFILSNVSEDAILVFSFIGMKTQEISVANKSLLQKVKMEDDAIDIEEVVAVGYGSMRKSDVTGAVTKANLEVFKDVPVNNVLESIKGSVPGLNVGGINTAGAIGSLSIRGQNSAAAGNSPLVIVDGVPGSLVDISPKDIESLTVLKDASAAAIYGSRSANGIIIIETKKGKGLNGKPVFDTKLSYGISNQLKPLTVYGAEGYLQRMLDIREANGLESNPDNIRYYLTDEELKNYDSTSNHAPTLKDPFDLISQLGSSFSTTISVSNSTEKTKYYISTSLTRQKGVVINDDYKHISARVNIDSDLTDWFNLGIQTSFSLRDYSGDSPSMYSSTMFSPYATVYNEDGSYKHFPQSTTSFASPFWDIATEDIDIRNNLKGTVTGTIKIPWVKGLTYHIIYSNGVSWRERNLFYDKNTTEGQSKSGKGERRYYRDYGMLLDNMIKYNNTFKEKHHVDATLLFSRERSAWEDLYAYAENFDNTALGTYALENGGTQTVSTGGGETKAIGMMARGTYSYNNKYSITGTVRRDGYSAFSKNKKWGVFPSVGLNWNLSRESFMENVEPLDNLALRLSYGKNGNQSISAYSTLARISTDNYIFYGDDSYTITQYISSLANNDLGWESTTGTNLGIDFSFINNRIRGSIELYKTKTNDLMFDLSLPTTSGMSEITSNIGEISNKGFEISLNTVNFDKGDFKWYSDFAFSLNRNEVVTILGKDSDGDGKEDDLVSDGYFIGKPLGTIYDYKVVGMWQQEDKDAGTIMEGMRPGDYMLEDIDSDGAITSDKDRQIIGNTDPNFRWSFTNTFKYKQISLMLYVYSVWGGNDYYLSDNNDPYNDGYVNTPNINHPVFDYWTPTNTNALFPRPDYKFSSQYPGIKYFDRSFIKLQKVSLSYDLSKFVKPWGINGMTCSLCADNIFTYAPHWEGLDPETDSGVTVNSVPSIRTWLFSVSLNF